MQFKSFSTVHHDAEYFALSGVSELPGRFLKTQTCLINHDILTASGLIGGSLYLFFQMMQNNTAKVHRYEKSEFVVKHETKTSDSDLINE